MTVTGGAGRVFLCSVGKNELGSPQNLCCNKGFLLRNPHRPTCKDSQSLGWFGCLFVYTINGLNASLSSFPATFPLFSDWTASLAWFRCFQDLFGDSCFIFLPCCFTKKWFAIPT